MKCVSVLKEEKKICEDIVKYKQSKSLESDVEFWNTKIEFVDIQILNITNAIECGKLDDNGYIQSLKQSLMFEEGFLKRIDQDKQLLPYEIPQLKMRINKRIELIQNELNERKATNENIETVKSIPEQIQLQQEQHISDNINNNQYDLPSINPNNIELTLQTNEHDNEQVLPSNENISSDNNNNEKQIDEQLISTLTERLNEYKSALEYFHVNDLPHQHKDATTKISTITNLLQKATNGEKITPSTIPHKITPEYISGYSNFEKSSRYKRVIQEKTEQLTELSEDLSKINESISKLTRKDSKRIEQSIKQESSDIQNQIDKLNKEIEELKQLSSSQWTPAPLFIQKEKNFKKEITNENISPNLLQVYIGNSTYDKDKVFLDVRISYSGKVQTEKIFQKPDGSFNQAFSFMFEKTEFKFLYRNCLDIKVYRKKTFRDVFKGDATISLADLKNKIEIVTNAEIQLESKRFKPTIEVKIEVRKPCVDTAYGVVTKKYWEIEKVYPEFKMECSQEEMNKLFSKEEIDDPDVIDNLVSLQVLEYKIKEYDGREDKKDFVCLMENKKKDIEDNLGGNLSYECYFNIMNKQLSHDTKLYQFFKQCCIDDKSDIVKNRIDILQKEIKEIELIINNSKN
jgi:TolA-binding protein